MPEALADKNFKHHITVLLIMPNGADERFKRA